MTVLYVCAFAVVCLIYMYVAANIVEQAEGNERVPPLFQPWVPEAMLRNTIFSLIESNIK